MTAPVRYIAICQDCQPVLPQPFSVEAERDEWATIHADATAHVVSRDGGAGTVPVDHLRITDSEDPRDSMAWPNPADPAEVQWRLRYGEPTRADLLVAASFMAAYAHLVELPKRLRNQRCEQIKAASKEASS